MSLIMNRELFGEILWDVNPEWESVTKVVITHQTRWSIYKERVFRNLTTNKLYKFWWGEGATEMQEGQNEPYGYNEVVPVEVTVTVTEYHTVKDGEKYEG